jgi:hypothetical protein
MRALALSLVLLFPLASGCATTANAVDPATQTLVEQLARENGDIERLSVHAVPAGGEGLYAIASTSAQKRGSRSDPEDHRAIETGEVVVLEEGGGVDITVPILQKGGVYTAAAGVTLRSGEDRDASIATAQSLAATIEAAMSKAAMGQPPMGK